MIITKSVKIKIIPRNKKSLETKYNITTTLGDCIVVDISDLSNNSKNIVLVECDFCNNTTKTTYQTYYKSHNNGGFPCCQSCINTKIKQTKKNKYGNENYCNTEKIKETKQNKYGDENYNNVDKNKETCLEKYGVDSYSHTSDFLEKVKQTNNEKYGVDFYPQTKEYSIKVKQTKSNKYGDENYNNRIKYKKTCLEKYGVNTFVLTDIFKEKQIKSYILHYDVTHPMKNEKYKKERIIKLKEMGYTITTDEYLLYRNLIYSETKKIKEKLLKDWDGFDFYDKKYIKDNYSLPYYHKNYPTIDHKISIYYGFKNNISIIDMIKIENLCITKRCINSSKGRKIETDYKV